MIGIALFKPDIPQNTAAIIRLCACFKLNVHIIEPCSFNLNDSRFKRVVMDYMQFVKITRYEDYKSFTEKNKNSRTILMTTKANKIYHSFKFKNSDILLFGKESAGVPSEIHKSVNFRLKIPIKKKNKISKPSTISSYCIFRSFKTN